MICSIHYDKIRVTDMDYFKIIVFLLGMNGVAPAATREASAKTIITRTLKCKSENGVSDADAIAVQTSTTGELKNNNVKCMLNCIMVAMDVISAEGDVHEDVLTRNFHTMYSAEKDKAAEYGKICKELGKAAVNTKDSPCEVAATIHKCIRETKAKHGLHHVMFR